MSFTCVTESRQHGSTVTSEVRKKLLVLQYVVNQTYHWTDCYDVNVYGIFELREPN
jgi:hypothetical protein